jgi:hypothetical protein
VVTARDRAVEIVGQVIETRFLGLRRGIVLHALVADPAELGEHLLALVVDEAEGMHAIAVHLAV